MLVEEGPIHYVLAIHLLVFVAVALTWRFRHQGRVHRVSQRIEGREICSFQSSGAIFSAETVTVFV